MWNPDYNLLPSFEASLLLVVKNQTNDLILYPSLEVDSSKNIEFFLTPIDGNSNNSDSESSV